ncbi:hypothetical protein EJ08DRAFT_716255 [Tothia fuscella]|uniref:Uncharacterized protein n=1 Tax=Tothia fuscella TaxID=1048955 RepID=A0A9P4NRK3_9PEZI|nr:hypothetical protein EJ08DRAFT_716255 [Tothia fuscella]
MVNHLPTPTFKTPALPGQATDNSSHLANQPLRFLPQPHPRASALVHIANSNPPLYVEIVGYITRNGGYIPLDQVDWTDIGRANRFNSGTGSSLTDNRVQPTVPHINSVPRVTQHRLGNGIPMSGHAMDPTHAVDIPDAAVRLNPTPTPSSRFNPTVPRSHHQEHPSNPTYSNHLPSTAHPQPANQPHLLNKYERVSRAPIARPAQLPRALPSPRSACQAYHIRQHHQVTRPSLAQHAPPLPASTQPAPSHAGLSGSTLRTTPAAEVRAINASMTSARYHRAGSDANRREAAATGTSRIQARSNAPSLLSGDVGPRDNGSRNVASGDASSRDTPSHDATAPDAATFNNDLDFDDAMSEAPSVGDRPKFDDASNDDAISNTSSEDAALCYELLAEAAREVDKRGGEAQTLRNSDRGDMRTIGRDTQMRTGLVGASHQEMDVNMDMSDDSDVEVRVGGRWVVSKPRS